MAAGKSERRFETLAQRLGALRPGTPCPCCGAPLEEDSPPRASGARSGARNLVCARCGCLVGPADVEVPGAAGAAYELAA